MVSRQGGGATEDWVLVGRGNLTAGQAAHLAVLSAVLVHVGAVKTRPHGRGGGGCGRVTHGAKAHGAGGLTTDRAAELLNRRPLFGLLPGLREVLIRCSYSIQEQPDAVSEWHDFIGDKEEEEVEIRHNIQEGSGRTLG